MIEITYICKNCDQEIRSDDGIEEAKTQMLCTICYQNEIAGSEKYKEVYDRCLNSIIADLKYVQGYQNEEAYALYQVRSIVGELRKEQNGGYLSVGYIEEKTQTIVSRCKDIARQKGMYHE
jgi:hypothetical protein